MGRVLRGQMWKGWDGGVLTGQPWSGWNEGVLQVNCGKVAVGGSIEVKSGVVGFQGSLEANHGTMGVEESLQVILRAMRPQKWLGLKGLCRCSAQEWDWMVFRAPCNSTTHPQPGQLPYPTYRSRRGRSSSPGTGNRWVSHPQSSGRSRASGG